VPEPLWAVIERCLSKDPERRPSAENLARALRTVADGIGVHATTTQIAAAEGVAALLAPHPDPPVVPGTTGAGSATVPNGVSYDPEGATSVLPQTGNAPGGPDAQPTSVLPSTGAPDPTSVMPPVSQEPPAPDGPHPWENQLRAARDRNEQTQIQYLDPSQDPLRHRPHRQARPPQQPPQRRQQYAPPQHQQYPPPQQYAPPQPQRYAPPRQPAQRPPREPRRSNPNKAHIPGLGCLKGCLITLVILFVAGWLVWELSPLQDWIHTTRNFWDELTHLVGQVSDWVGRLGGPDNGSGTQ
jgi:serine/threonine-protein kinase